MSAQATPEQPTFDRGAAITRSLLGWGVVAGPFYLVMGLGQALTRDGFDLSRHALSQLMLGDAGWIQVTDLALTGIMVLAAAVGFDRLTGRRSVSVSLGLFGVAMVASSVFPPDPAEGFPPGSEAVTEPSASGLLHLAFGAIGFIALAVAAFAAARWFAGRDQPMIARWSRIAAIVVLVGFLGGAAMPTITAVVALLWIAVVAGFAWLLVASLRAYRLAPHPDSG